MGELETHALPAGRGRRRRSPDTGLPGVRRQGNAHFEDQQDLNLVEATAFEKGVALLRYEI